MEKAGALVIALTLVSGSALANPRGVFAELYGSSEGQHVRLTNEGNGSVSKTMVFYGTSQSPWVETGRGKKGDTGSGVETWAEHSMCDCNVPTGMKLTYAPYSPNGGDFGAVTVTVPYHPPASTDCEAECAAAEGAGTHGSCSFGSRNTTGALSLVVALGFLAWGLHRRR